MDDIALKKRNDKMLAELYPSFRSMIEAVMAELKSQGFRPRIQCAWRSPQEQLDAVARGASKLRFGFHNVTGPKGEPQSLAVDMLDDLTPLNPSKRYLLTLGAVARTRGLTTGVTWGVPPAMRRAIEHAMNQHDWAADVKVGWDPCHVEPTNLTPAQARAGARP